MKKITFVPITFFTILISISIFSCPGPVDPQTYLVTVNGSTGGGNYTQGATVTILTAGTYTKAD